VAQAFIEKGYAKVYALKGGWKEWSRSKYPVENK
jgi:rhodanese-related sulfurtransferase